jgi:hypothetical protein
MSGCAAPTLKQVGGGRVENMYQEMVYYNRMHVKIRLSETGGGREGGKYASGNGILQPNACEN